jgi:hypothetical protein
MDNVFDLYASDEEEEQLRTRFSSMSSTSIGTSIRSCVVLGPPQDVDIRPKLRIPPQVHLARFEDQLHKFTQSLSMDKVFACTLAYRPHSPSDGMFRSAIDHRPCDEGTENRRRIPLDDFDKRLGYRKRHSNPVTEIKSSFLGPLMRIFRIFCCIVRVVFNVGVWSDPYMSFWVLCFLILTMIVLIMFPWRLFFFVVGMVCFGPQVRVELKWNCLCALFLASDTLLHRIFLFEGDWNSRRRPKMTHRLRISPLARSPMEKLSSMIAMVTTGVGRGTAVASKTQSLYLRNDDKRNLRRGKSCTKAQSVRIFPNLKSTRLDHPSTPGSLSRRLV